MQLIGTETNSFAEKHEKKLDSSSTSDSPGSSKFSPVSSDEVRLFFGLIILMSIVKKPDLKMYFSTNDMIATPFFNKVISRRRFLKILQYLHFTSDESAKKLQKLKPVIEILNKKFKTAYVPEQNISIDESLFSWKGRLGFRQYVPSKRSRYGIKIYKLSESLSGYIWNFLVYTGKETEMLSTQGLYGERIVKSLLSDLTGKGHNLYLDRFFTSPSLAQELHCLKTNICGTVMKNRKGMPKHFPVIPFRKGDVQILQNKSVNIIAYKDKKKDVLLLTTIHNNSMEKSGKKDRATGVDILKPTCVMDYNKNMGGVDIGDAIMIHYPSYRKTRKWYRKLFFGLLDMALLNANILYNIAKKENTSFLTFRMRIVEQIVEKYALFKEENQLRNVNSPTPLRLLGRHFPSKCIDESGIKHRRRCIVCSQTVKAKRKRSESVYECKKCDVGLCVDPCFEIYHTQSPF